MDYPVYNFIFMDFIFAIFFILKFSLKIRRIFELKNLEIIKTKYKVNRIYNKKSSMVIYSSNFIFLKKLLTILIWN